MAFVEFICGCQTKEILARENIKTMDFVEFDEEGMLICTIHRARRKNWRSIPIHPEASNVRIKKSYLGKTPQQIEGHVVFGEDWPTVQYDLQPVGFDRRDNRDPEQVYNDIKSYSSRNGKMPLSIAYDETHSLGIAIGYTPEQISNFHRNGNG